MRPLDRVGAIKAKLGIVLAGAVAATVVVVVVADRVGLPAWVAGLGAFLVALGVVQLLARGMTQPLRALARQADRLAAGEPVEAVAVTARDEVGRLAVAFNNMAVEVATTDRVRRDLVANVSHELRTPLAGLRAVLENLRDGVVAPDASTWDDLLAQSERLGRLVEDLLDLSRLEAGAVPLRRQPVDVRAVVDEAVASCGVAARTDVTVTPDLVVPADHDRLRQVVVNLLDNAHRHGPVEGVVHVDAHRVGDSVRLVVADDGPGIAVDEADRIFARFHRTDEGRATATGGSGLGLSITRWIVDLHGGSVHVDRPGEPGARLVVDLPSSPHDSEAVA